MRSSPLMTEINKQGKGPFQDALALLEGMVTSELPVVKDGAAEQRSEYKGKTIRMLDSVGDG